jgi:hypothetical protein
LAGIAAGSIGEHEFAPDYFDVLRHMTTVLLSSYKMRIIHEEVSSSGRGLGWMGQWENSEF